MDPSIHKISTTEYEEKIKHKIDLDIDVKQVHTDKHMIKKENANFHNHFHTLYIIPVNINQSPP